MKVERKWVESLRTYINFIEKTSEEREAERIKGIQDCFDYLADDDETRMALIELIELCDGNVPSETGICTSCGSDEARYTSHYNNNSECQD